MLSVVMLSSTYKPFMLSVTMLRVVTLTVSHSALDHPHSLEVLNLLSKTS
jgi:hypothetical protein